MSHLIQVHLVGLLPRILKLSSSLLLQRHHHHVVTPETQHALGSGSRKYTTNQAFFLPQHFRRWRNISALTFKGIVHGGKQLA